MQEDAPHIHLSTVFEVMAVPVAHLLLLMDYRRRRRFEILVIFIYVVCAHQMAQPRVTPGQARMRMPVLYKKKSTNQLNSEVIIYVRKFRDPGPPRPRPRPTAD